MYVPSLWHHAVHSEAGGDGRNVAVGNGVVGSGVGVKVGAGVGATGRRRMVEIGAAKRDDAAARRDVAHRDAEVGARRRAALRLGGGGRAVPFHDYI